MKKINCKAVLIGTLVDVCGSFLFGIITGLIFGVSSNLLPLYLVLGLIVTAIGGFVAAKISLEGKVFNATLVGFVGIVIALISKGGSPDWYTLVSCILMPPSAYFGGKVAITI